MIPSRIVPSRRTLAVLLPTMALVPLTSTMVAVALPAIMDDLELGTSAIAWLVTGYLMLAAIAQTPAGTLGDRAGHQRILRAGTALLAVSSFVAGTSGAPVRLVAARLCQALAGAAIAPNVLALIRRRGAALDRDVDAYLFATFAGALVGVTGGGVVVSLAGWRAAFVGTGLLGLLALAATSLLPKPHPADASSVETRRRKPRLPTRSLIGPAAGIALASLSLYVVLLVIPLRLAASGLPSFLAGSRLAYLIVALGAATLAHGRLRSRVGPAAIVAGGSSIGAGASVVIAASPPGSLPATVMLVAVGMGLGIVLAEMYSTGLHLSGSDDAGTISGILSTARQGGSIVGTATLPAVIAAGGHAAGLLVAASATLLVGPVLVMTRVAPSASSASSTDRGPPRR